MTTGIEGGTGTGTDPLYLNPGNSFSGFRPIDLAEGLERDRQGQFTMAGFPSIARDRLLSRRPSMRHPVRTAVALALGLAVAFGGWSLWLELRATPSASAAAPMSLPGVQGLYAADLVARINAERAARAAAGEPVPQLQVDPGLAADAQAWSAHLAATGTVADPSLPPCTARPARSASSPPTRAAAGPASGPGTAPTAWTAPTWPRPATGRTSWARPTPTSVSG